MIYLVTGYMRSGTSMLMQACEAGGLPVARSQERDEFNRVNSDERYKPNPHGLYELGGLLSATDWPKRYDGHAVKVVATNLSRLRPHCYSAVIMMRDQEEIRQSLEAAFGIASTLDQILDWQMRAVDILCRRDDVVSVKAVWYTEVLADPVNALASLGWPIDAAKAASVVDPMLYRQRAGSLVEGI